MTLIKQQINSHNRKGINIALSSYFEHDQLGVKHFDRSNAPATWIRTRTWIRTPDQRHLGLKSGTKGPAHIDVASGPSGEQLGNVRPAHHCTHAHRHARHTDVCIEVHLTAVSSCPYGAVSVAHVRLHVRAKEARDASLHSSHSGDACMSVSLGQGNGVR
ncbi:unnamed protein product [Danaus chrysippus]|uniref:(African queen) hypothetical protein n=1 Tax=Danaus chrysippus TaxID=151541 RepID=A0A8J2QVH4_9NEOP|nr:unnamed protein product [Danaus chrysippus]